MAKHLSMEDLIKKYQHLKTTRQTSSITETNKTTHEKDRRFDNEYSKSFSSSHNGTKPSDRPLSSAESSADLTSENSCKVCLDAVANCAFIECGHIVSCLNCAKLLTRCPICRETIKRTLRVYKS